MNYHEGSDSLFGALGGDPGDCKRGCLDDRRPTFLRDLVGDDTHRLSNQMRNGCLIKRAFFFGPPGSGKTTASYVVARYHFCANRVGIGDRCGQCEFCRKPLGGLACFYDLAGADLEQDWAEFCENTANQLWYPGACFFFDEFQDLSDGKQKWLLKPLETATATVVVATTHKQKVVDAILNRFGSNVFEMRYPPRAAAVDKMASLCLTLGIIAQPHQLARVADFYHCCMRQLVEFLHSAHDQLAGSPKILTDEYINEVIGIREANTPSAEPIGTSRPRL